MEMCHGQRQKYTLSVCGKKILTRINPSPIPTINESQPYTFIVKSNAQTLQINIVFQTTLYAEAPGCAIDEVVLWCKQLYRLIFTSRSISNKTFDENYDEQMGANKIVLVDEAFIFSKMIDIKFTKVLTYCLHRFSRLAFVPDTGVNIALLLFNFLRAVLIDLILYASRDRM